MFTVHHLNNSRSHRVLWALEELGLPYQIQAYQRDAATMLAPPELKAVHPLGLAPVLAFVDAAGERVVLAESGAILEALAAHADGRLRPSQGADGRACTYWLHYAEGSLMPLLLLKLVMGQISGKKIPWAVRPIAKAIAGKVNAAFIDPRLKLHLDYIDQQLSTSAFFAGEALSIADIQMSFPVLAAQHRTGLGNRKHLQAWVASIEAMPGLLRAIDKGGPIGFE
jgi:glutathione S-transferase